MSVVLPRRTIAELSQAEDFKKTVLAKVSDLVDNIEIMHNMVLLAVYIRSEKIGSIIRPQENVEEDVFQGKVGMVLGHGPAAFQDDETVRFYGRKAEVGDFVAFRVGDTWSFTLRDVPCRLVSDTHIKLKIKDPTVVF